MKYRFRLLARRLVLSAALLAAATTVAGAQINDPSVKDGNIQLLPEKRPIVEYVLAGGFLLAALAVGFKPTKRAGSE
ncbi:MAG TPA: hypothetical protein VJZ71_19460 [Phycisphaerae bacterium]|nr:hypothetical protein [Phycisphaerae bacterium]